MNLASGPLSGLPDFGAPIAAPGQTASMFAPYLTGTCVALPLRLTIALNSDGTPRMSLVLVKSIGNLSASGQYAIFDFTLAGDFDLESALNVARNLDGSATVAPIVIDSGFTRMFPTNSAVAVSDDLLVPVPIGGSGSEYARWTARLSSSAGDLIEGALGDSAVLLGAQVEYQYAGIAPRLQCVASFKPSALIGFLAASRPDRRIASSDLASALQEATRQGVVSLQQSATADPYETLADRIAMSFGTFVPALSAGDPPSLLLNDPATLSADSLVWDLSQPCKVFRQGVMTLDQIGGFSPATVTSLVREVTVPVMPLGQWSIDVTANLPAHRAPVGELGISVEIAANPPWRPTSINHQLPLIEPDDSATFPLQLSPREALSYTVVPYTVLAGAAGQVQNYTGTVSQHTDTWVRLSMDDFPVTFAHVSATAALLALASVIVTFSYSLPTGPVQQQMTLGGQVADTAFPFPNVASGGSIEVAAVPLQGGTTLSLGPSSPERIALDLPSFREYGPHRIDLSVDQAPAEPLVIELIAEAHRNDATVAPGTVFFSGEQPTAQWGYFAASPFACGFCYRVATASQLDGAVASGATPPGSASVPASGPVPWSAVQPPFQPLRLHADGSRISDETSTAPPAVNAAIST